MAAGEREEVRRRNREREMGLWKTERTAVEAQKGVEGRVGARGGGRGQGGQGGGG